MNNKFEIDEKELENYLLLLENKEIIRFVAAENVKPTTVVINRSTFFLYK